MFLAAIAAISLAAIAPAANAALFHHSTIADDAQTTRNVQTGSYY
jgi:hypothetical protein